MKLNQILITILIAFVVSFGTFSMLEGKDGSTAIEQKESVYDRVMRTKTIRCGYFVRPPILSKDPNTGAITGIVPELMELIGQKLSLKIEWAEETPPPDLVNGLSTDRFDVACIPGWVNAQRARSIDYTTPYMYERSAIFAHVGNNQFDHNVTALNDTKYKMSIMDGSSPAYVTQLNFPKAQKISIPEGAQLIQILMDTGAGKSDATFYAQLEGLMYMKANPGQLQMVQGSDHLGTFPLAFGLKRGQDEFRQMLNNTMMDIQAQGALDKIIAKYKIFPGIFLHPAPGYQVAQ